MQSRTPMDVNSPAADTKAVSWVMLIYAGSGMCSLIDEVVWVRLLKLTLGNTVYASSVVVSVFMGGLALGAFLMAKYADRIRQPLRLYAVLELCATVSALSLPWALGHTETLYRWFYITFHPSSITLLLVQVLVSATILLVPTMVMGSTLPLLGRCVAALNKQTGWLVGRLYALNMLGATIGCFLAGFVLIRLLGVMGTLYAAAGINFLVALGGWQLSRRYDAKMVPAPDRGTQQEADARASLPSGRERQVLVLAFFVSGLMSIGYELIWMRTISVFIGGYTYSFSAVLTIYLLGNVIGAAIGSRLSKRLNHPEAGFALSIACLGALGVMAVPWLTEWYSVSERVMSFISVPNTHQFARIVIPLVHSTFLFLVPAITMGIGFPLALQAWGNCGHKVGETTGAVYAANTVGAVFGGVLTGFLLIPMLGVQLSITILGLAGLGLGAAIVSVYRPGNGKAWKTAHFVTAGAFTGIAIVMPSSLFKEKIVVTPNRTTLAVEEGVTTTVSVRKSLYGKLLYSDDFGIGGDGVTRVPQKFLGHLGVLLNPNAKDVLSIGFGTGETTATLAKHGLRRIDCVEIAREIVKVALEFFGHINLGDRLDQDVNMIFMDGKNYLHMTPRRYDIILNDADSPDFPGSAPMFAKEHFGKALEHLSPGGLFITKLPRNMSFKATFDSILGTFLDVFPEVTLWYPVTKPYPFFYLVGSREKQSFSLQHVKYELEKGEVRESLAFLNIRNSLDVFSSYIGDRSDIERYLNTFHVNSDYSPFVEFNIGAHTTGQDGSQEGGFFGSLLKTVRRGSFLKHADWAGVAAAKRQEWQTEYDLLYALYTHVLKIHAGLDRLAVLESCHDGLKLVPEHPLLLGYEHQTLTRLRAAVSRGKGNAILAGLNGLLKKRPDIGSRWAVGAWIFLQKQDAKRALRFARKAVEVSPKSAAAHATLAEVFANSGRVAIAIPHCRTAIKLARLKGQKADLHYVLGLLLNRSGKQDEAIREFREALRYNPNHRLAKTRLETALGKPS